MSPRSVGAQRATLDNPAQAVIERFALHRGVALLGTRLIDIAHVRDLLDYAMTPAWRAGCRLLVHADRTLEDLDESRLLDVGFEHAWTVERARHLARIMATATMPAPDPGEPIPARALDSSQLRAIAAGDGVVQVIAPAGSGKTTVLVERVRKLLRRGTAPRRILCTTFNNAAAKGLRARLEQAGVTSVEARTLHSIGAWILRDERLLSGKLSRLTLPQWRRLCTIVHKRLGDEGEWIDPPDAQAAISELKLGRLLNAAEWSKQAPDDARGRTIAALYAAYESEMRSQRAYDFDDQIFHAVRVLRSRQDIRQRWQQKFDRVLVDEYQDIEPAQELLVQILAAPQDSLFVVGDEDQVLYGWRRASTLRIVELDQTYPGLERVALETNYRCPPEVVTSSAKLITHNRLRFPKTIRASIGRTDEAGVIVLGEHDSSAEAARWAARELSDRTRGDIVVLARTTRLLRAVAEACIEPDVKICAPAAVFEAYGARQVIEAHLRLAARPASAEPDDVLTVMRHPSRGLPPQAEDTVAQRLQSRASWREALSNVRDDGRGRLEEAADVLDMLRDIEDAGRFIRLLRTVGGLDRHFDEYQRLSGGAEQIDIEELDDAEYEARGQTVIQYAAMRANTRDRLLAIRDDEEGIELATVHGAKGREWPTVIVFGFDEGQLPHRKALDVSAEEIAAGEGLEAERRVAYVALTRAQAQLHVLSTSGRTSAFAWQAGLTDEPVQAADSVSVGTGFQPRIGPESRRRDKGTRATQAESPWSDEIPEGAVKRMGLWILRADAPRTSGELTCACGVRLWQPPEAVSCPSCGRIV